MLLVLLAYAAAPGFTADGIFFSQHDGKPDRYYPFPVIEPLDTEPARDGSGLVFINTSVYEVNRDNLFKIRVEFSVDGPEGPWHKCWLVDDEVIVRQKKAADINNRKQYQIGSKRPLYVALAGTILYVVWDTRNAGNGLDISALSADDVYVRMKFRFKGKYERITRNLVGFSIDNKEPEPPDSLEFREITWDNNLVLDLGRHGFDRNFREYVVYYSDKRNVSGKDMPHGPEQDINLGRLDFNGAGTTAIAGLEPNKRYYMNIWIYDEFGNSARGKEISVFMREYRDTLE